MGRDGPRHSALEVRCECHRWWGERRWLDDSPDRTRLDLVGQVDYRRPVGQWPRDPHACQLLSGADGAVGKRAILRAGHDRGCSGIYCVLHLEIILTESWKLRAGS